MVDEEEADEEFWGQDAFAEVGAAEHDAPARGSCLSLAVLMHTAAPPCLSARGCKSVGGEEQPPTSFLLHLP